MLKHVFRIMLVEYDPETEECLVRHLARITPNHIDLKVDWHRWISHAAGTIINRVDSVMCPNIIITHHDDPKPLGICTRPHRAEDLVQVLVSMAVPIPMLIRTNREGSRLPEGQHGLSLVPTDRTAEMLEIVRGLMLAAHPVPLNQTASALV